MDKLKTLDLTFDDLPEDLISDLRDYLLQTYPDTYINISFGPLERFKKLPPEILSKITRSRPELRPSSQYISTNLRQQAIPDVFQVECTKSLSEREMRLELENNENATYIILSDDIESNNIFAFKGPYKFIKDNEGPSIMSDNLSVYEYYYNTGKLGIETLPINPQRYHKLPFGTGNVDLISAYNIRLRRKVCMNYNNSYAYYNLISTYNRTCAKNYEFESITVEDLKNIFIVNTIAMSFDGSLKNLDGIYNVGENDNWDIIASKFIPIYEQSRNVIRNKITEMIDANI